MTYRQGILPWEYPMEDVRVYCRACHELVSRVSDDIWVECQKRLPHELEQLLKSLRNDYAIAYRVEREA